MSIYTIGVIFNGETNKRYDYLCKLPRIESEEGPALSIGDKVAVQTYDDQIELAVVATIHDIRSPKATKWAFQRIDTELINARKEAARLKNFLAVRAEELAKQKAYEELFASDPDSKEAVERLKTLGLW